MLKRNLTSNDRFVKETYKQLWEQLKPDVQVSEVGIPKTKSFIFSSAFMLACLVYVIVAWTFVSNLFVFSAIFVFSIGLAFLSSLTEAAFSKISSYKDELNLYLNEKRAFDIVQRAPVKKEADEFRDRLLTEAVRLTPAQKKEFRLAKRNNHKFARRLKKADRQRSLMRPAYTKQAVGALSAFSLTLSTFLTAFLPYSIDTDVFNSSQSVDFMAACQANSIQTFDWLSCLTSLPLENSKVFIFIVSAVPVLLLGKIIPKFLGLTFPTYFALKLFWFGRVANVLFGWLSSGAMYLPQAFIQRKLLTSSGTQSSR